MPETSPRAARSWSPGDAFGLDRSAGADLTDLASTALEAARSAASVLVRGGPVTGVETKISDTDMVSDVDRRAEAAVNAVLSRRRPDDGILAEEGTSRGGSSGVSWVIDPLDGTTNFLFGIPQFSVSVAAQAGGDTLVGVVLDPSRDELWAAAAGHGAFLNGARCQAAEGRSRIETALVATGFGYRAERRAWQAEVVSRVIPAVRDIRRLGSAALDLSWTGGGRFDAYFEWGLNPWDFCAGALVAAEAGARVAVLGDRTVVAAAPSLFEPMVSLLEDAGALDAPDGPEPRSW